jgi:fibronectin type 3 domain-containing protein
MIDVGDTTEFTVENLEAGTYYFAVTAVDKAGNESDLSEELRVEVGGP